MRQLPWPSLAAHRRGTIPRHDGRRGGVLLRNRAQLEETKTVGMCCWQHPCWFFAQWPDILGNWSSILYFNLYPLDDLKTTPKDYKIINCHVKSGTKTVATSTQNLGGCLRGANEAIVNCCANPIC